jgi:excisionase family DNA binding protein
MLTTTQAAKRLGITPRHVRSLIKQGQLAATAITARTYVIEERHVEALARKRARSKYSGIGQPIKKPPPLLNP